MLSEAEHLTAEQRFRQAFDRLKTDTPRVLKPGTPVSQNHVALEAGVVTSALRKSRFPSLIREIQAYVDLGQPATPSKRQTQLKQRKGRADLNATLSDARGSASAAVLLGSVVPCFRVWRIDGCAVISAGALQVSSAFGGQALRQSSPLFLAGVRVQAVLDLSESISVRPFVDAQAVLTRTSLVDGASRVTTKSA